ncbi:MAG: hypothetical protein GXX79_17055 [Actinomycetales bacterium]|nr:hypothetical protein [Actinomycetales bacterium]
MLIELGLLVYCLIDCIQTPDDEVRNLRKGYWILLVIVVPLAGSIAWLFAGRPKGAGIPGHARSGHGWFGGQQPRVLGPDDDPEFLAQLGRTTGQRRREEGDDPTLSAWEQELRRHEETRTGSSPTDEATTETPQDDPRRDGDEESTR